MLGVHTMQGKQTFDRNYRSQLRVAMFHAYGGSDWVNFLLALGGDGINEDLIQCYNEEINRRTPGGARGRSPQVGPRLSERSLAAAEGCDSLPPVRGVKHQRSQAKVVRKAARALDKKLKGDRRMKSESRKRLKKVADNAWAKADKLSAAAGRAYYDRVGNRVNAAKDKENMVTLVLKAYAEKRSLEYVFDG